VSGGVKRQHDEDENDIQNDIHDHFLGSMGEARAVMRRKFIFARVSTP
jgi:hypothetical protein